MNKPVPAEPAQPAGFSLHGSIADMRHLDRTGPRQSRRFSSPTDNASMVYRALEVHLPKLPTKYHNSFLELISIIGAAPSCFAEYPAYTRITKQRLNSHSIGLPRGWVAKVKQAIVDTQLDEQGKGVAYKLKPAINQSLADASITSLAALRALPEGGSGVPNVDSLTPVNVAAIELGVEVFTAYRSGEGHELLQNEVSAIPSAERDLWLESALIELRALRDEARVRDGFVLQTYSYSTKESRYYGEGAIHIQRTPRLLRRIVLHGCWDTDIECCHHSILLQLSERKGLELPALAEYVSDRRTVRETLHRELNVPMDTVKEVLIATINRIGAERLESLVPNHAQNALLNALRADIRNGARSITPKVLWNRVGSYLNQTEKLAIEAAVQASTSTIATMHDGYVTTVREDCRQAEEVMQAATGMILKLEQEQLLLDGFPIPESS